MAENNILKDRSYTVIRSRRKTLAVQLQADGKVVVRAPLGMPESQIAAYVEQCRPWIRKKRAVLLAEAAGKRNITEEERKRGIARAKETIPQKTAFFAEHMQVTYGRITIREQKTRWGSCSSKGNLNFNWKLVLMPEEVLDYVVVHELAHRKEMNHSIRFWKLVEKELPDYKKRRQLLRQLERKLL